MQPLALYAADHGPVTNPPALRPWPRGMATAAAEFGPIDVHAAPLGIHTAAARPLSLAKSLCIVYVCMHPGAGLQLQLQAFG